MQVLLVTRKMDLKILKKKNRKMKEKFDLNDKLAEAISGALHNKKKGLSLNKKVNGKNELQLYESTGNINGNLKKILDALMTIQPTSIESERVFSMSANFCTKKRSSLNDNSIDCLCFLKSYFLQI